MPSSATTRPTSSTVANMARCMAIAASRPNSSAIVPGEAAKKLEHQPPFRPEAPKPAISFSTMATRSDGSAFFR